MQEVFRPSQDLMVTFLVPVFNEEKTLPIILERLLSLSLSKREIVIIDDGSTDQSVQVSQRYVNQFPFIKLISRPVNQGKGAALRSGSKIARGEIIAIQDADLEYNPEDLLTLINCVAQGEVDVAYGSRFAQSNPVIYWRYLFGNKLLTFLVRFLTGLPVTDTYTCYKVFRRNVWEKLNLQSNRFEIEAEISIKVGLSGYRFREFPIRYLPRALASGKKINWRDGIKGLMTIVRFYLKYKLK